VENGTSDAKSQREIGFGTIGSSQSEKTGKTTRNPEIKSSFRNNRNCKNTAVGCAGQARTTICSILLGLRCTNLGNPGNLLCKTEKTAPNGQNPADS
jgi:hypothetical protein